jgi:hypothetical protein
MLEVRQCVKEAKKTKQLPKKLYLPRKREAIDHAIDLLGTPRVGAPRQTVKIASKDQKVALRKDEVSSPNVDAAST